MPELKHDASTNIDELALRFVDEMTRKCASIREVILHESQRGREATTSRNPPPLLIPVLTFRVAKGRGAFRTPAVQAEILVEGLTQVCWSAHMLDKARDINMYANGTFVRNLDLTLSKTYLKAFKAAWVDIRTKVGLVDARGGWGWYTIDPLHVELPDSKLKMTDERSIACLDEYARLTRVENRPINKRFEENYANALRAHVQKYSKETQKK